MLILGIVVAVIAYFIFKAKRSLKKSSAEFTEFLKQSYINSAKEVGQIPIEGDADYDVKMKEHLEKYNSFLSQIER